MANASHLHILWKGVDSWNKWRYDNPSVRTDLTGADLRGGYLRQADLNRAYLNGADLREADLGGAFLHKANLSVANLRNADLNGAEFLDANLMQTDLSGANLTMANLGGADLTGANLTAANLSRASLILTNLHRTNFGGAILVGAYMKRAVLTDTILRNADLTGVQVYGVSVWNAKLEGAIEKDIVITDYGEPTITVDSLEVAQFIHLLVNNEKIRHVIDTITSKVVLILGRFTKERKDVLDAIRDRLRHLNYIPVLFDFEKPASRDFTETVSTLAHMARFIIPDLSEEKSVPQELQAIVPDLAMPVLPIVHEDHRPWGMWKDFYKYPWVLTEHRYGAVDQLLRDLEDKLIPKALEKIQEIERSRCRDQDIQPQNS